MSPDIHAAGVAFHRSVEEALDLGEGDDLVEFAADLRALHAEDGAVEKNIFATGELRVKAGADFEEARDAAAKGNAAGGGLGDARENFQERGFARTVAADDADDLAPPDVEGDVLQRPKIFFGGRGAAARTAREESAQTVGEPIAQGVVTRRVTDAITLGKAGDGDDGRFAHSCGMGRAQITSANWRSVLRKNHTPVATKMVATTMEIPRPGK